jgi:hypothetical protein
MMFLPFLIVPILIAQTALECDTRRFISTIDARDQAPAAANP